MIRIGDKIIAINHDHKGRYEKGDTLKVTYVDGLDVIATNITRGNKGAVLLRDEYQPVNPRLPKKVIGKAYFLGIPVFTIKEDD